jgi:two-component system OmpR family sensor kinase
MMPALTLRLRMILLFCVVIGVFLAATYEVVYTSFVREVQAGLDDRLLYTSKTIVAGLMAGSSSPSLAGMEVPSQLLELLGPDGRVLDRSRSLMGLDLPTTTPPSPTRPAFETVITPLGKLRVATIPFKIADQPHWLVIAESTGKIDQVNATFRERAFGLWTVSLLLTTLIAVWYVGRSLSPIVDLNHHVALLTARAAQVSHQDLQVSLPIRNANDEIGVLSSNFNVLFARLGAVVGQLRQFVSDAAHELRTPLSVVRGETQFLLSQPRSLEEYQHILQTVDGELSVMVRIIEGLFTLSMADAGQLQLANERMHLNEVIEEACGIATPAARRKQIRIERMPLPEVEFLGDQALLRQLFLILLENAVKYSPSGTVIRVEMAFAENRPLVAIRDEGYGISAVHLPHIFKRFYRAAAQSSDETRSGGLGLAIAEAIMRAHGGEIRCQSEVGRGSVFTLFFPAQGSTPVAAIDRDYAPAARS